MVKFKDFSRPLSVFQVLFKANFIFKDFSRQSCIFKFFSSLCEPWTFRFFCLENIRFEQINLWPSMVDITYSWHTFCQQNLFLACALFTITILAIWYGWTKPIPGIILVHSDYAGHFIRFNITYSLYTLCQSVKPGVFWTKQKNSEMLTCILRIQAQIIRILFENRKRKVLEILEVLLYY